MPPILSQRIRAILCASNYDMIPISYIPTPRPDTTSSTFYGSLPSLSTIMDSSRRRLWNELADGQRGMPNAASDFNSASHSSSSSLLSVGNSTTLDELEFLIPGEPILCKVKSKSET
ncbi:hypothetical protein Pst134EA_029074 [Puccinia striiformis f. sp. tritici]|uniref:hypothetical protein n=1 Tax=Puccinia striiformis f. sp. tritici TaxID=168172 RepID=UPI002008C7CE|nr:hypothetical protein Pst134EA_029074 [Puccinia striiformis f. sp. tritici]KAH9441134.1 hypothetical protein Pst134EB_029783 [Puccinia striiformis f. sp. tritici]KAH9447087.1 hypothetical protein Pst134EA_029074 [Puccinia striiformis f. sp. tritici]